MSDDLPKYWNEETGEVIDSKIVDTQASLMPIEDVTPLPTISEQKQVVNDDTELSKESKSMLSSLIEMNKVAQTLDAIRSSETAEKRKTVVNAWCEAFISSRMRNNVVAEELKSKLLLRLIDRVDNLDLDTAARIYTDLHDVSNTDASQALASMNGEVGYVGNQSGSNINLTINNATSDGASITNNTLNTGGQPVAQLKEVSTMNSSIKAWNTIPLPKRKSDE